MTYTPSEEFEKHFYQMLRELPREKINDWIGLDSDTVDKLIEYSNNERKRRPINKTKIYNLRVRLLNHLDSSDNNYSDIALEY